MTRFFNGVCVAGRVAYFALAGVAVFAASTSSGSCAVSVAVGLLSLWYIGETLLALSSSLVGRAYLAGFRLARRAAVVLASCEARLRVRVAAVRVSVRRACADRSFFRRAVAAAFLLAFVLSIPVSLSAGIPGLTPAGNTSPWETVGTKLCELFYGKLGKALAIVAVVIGGLLYAFGEGGSKSQLAGIAFGTGMVLMAPAFLTWLFGNSVLGTTGNPCVFSAPSTNPLTP